MAKKQVDKDLIVGIDIGTSKVVTIIGEVTDENSVHVVGIGSHPSKGLKRGVVVNIESTVQSIQRSVEEAELMAGCQVHSAYTGIAGSHIKGFNSHGIVAIKGQEVTQADVHRVIDAARAVAIPADQKILHILPQEYIIDNQDCIREPVGMSGVRLEAKVHIATGAVSAAQNIVKCVESCNIDVNDVILEQLASSYSVLTEDEKELGVCLIDIGGGTTDMAIFIDGAIRHSAVIPIAGDQVTNDLAIALRTPTQNAEKLKKQHACCLVEMAEESEMIEVPSVGGRKPRNISRKVLAEVCEPRYDELFRLVRAELRRSGFEQLIASGIVITGGASQIEGGLELAERVFDIPVRLGMPERVTGLADVVKNPIYATSVGLLLYGHDQQAVATTAASRVRRKKAGGNKNTSMWGRMKSWFQGNF
jgi:cell division protein FtsA